MILSVLALVLGVLAYGVAGARLSDGAQAEGGALTSPAWWIGTALQGAGTSLTPQRARLLQALEAHGAISAAARGRHELTRARGTRSRHSIASRASCWSMPKPAAAAVESA